MEELKAHPNRPAVLYAWRRLSEGVDAPEGPTTDDYPGLVGRLFVLNHVADRDYSFRRVGYALEQLFGRQLVEHNFLSIWSESDRRLVNAALIAAAVDRGPTLIRARGETLVGKRVDLEFALAPLFGRTGTATRFLGLCQTMTPEETLAGRPLRRLQALAIYPPAPTLHPAMRIVSSRWPENRRRPTAFRASTQSWPSAVRRRAIPSTPAGKHPRPSSRTTRKTHFARACKPLFR